jgi:hypothetical protein
MEDLAVMTVLEGETYLSEPIKDLILCEIVELASTRLALVLIFDLSLQIPVVSVVHHDAKLALLGFIDFAEADDVWVIEHLEDLGFSECFLALFVAHGLDINLLNDCVLLV